MEIKEINESDYLTKGLAELLCKSDLDALDAVLKKYNKSARAYSLLEIRDDSVCLVCNNGVWEIFYEQRGQKSGKEEYERISDACIRMISKFADSDQEEEKMISAYTFTVEKNRQKEVSMKAVYNKIENMVAS